MDGNFKKKLRLIIDLVTKADKFVYTCQLCYNTVIYLKLDRCRCTIFL